MGEVARLRSDFKAMDKDRDGVISASDFALAIASQFEGINKLELEALFAAVDVNGDGEITYAELLSAANQGKAQLKAAGHCKEFDRFDEIQLSSSETGVLLKQSVEGFEDPVRGEKQVSFAQV